MCVVCGRPIGTGDVVYLVNGQRVPIHISDCYAQFRKNPQAYLAALQPHGAFLGAGGEAHRVRTTRGVTSTGTWDEIVLQMKMDDRYWAEVSVSDYMEQVARRSRDETGVIIPADDAESFVRGSAVAGMLRILR